MAIQKIEIGSPPKGEGGDTWRSGSDKVNANFNDLDERTTLAQNTADSKTANETDEFLLSRENHTGSQPMSTVTGLQDALDSASDAVDNVNDAVIAVDIIAKSAIPSNQKGMANGVATLDSAGVIPANQLPSYVDDVLEFATLANFPSVGEAGKIYIAIETSKTYRWTGTVYVAIGGAEAADTALRLFTARTIAISGGATGTATQFDGSANITIPITEIDAAKITKGLIPSARIPTLNQSTTGNAATTTKLATPRKINGVSFDGTGDINLDVYNKSEVDTAIANATPTIPDATTNDKGIVRLADSSDISNNSETVAVSPKDVNAMISGLGVPTSAPRALLAFSSSPKTGTNSSGGNTITATITAHGLAVGDVINITYSYKTTFSSSTTTGTVTVTSVTNANTFVFSGGNSYSGSSYACTLNFAIKAKTNISAITDLGVGYFRIAMSTALASNNYLVFYEAYDTDNTLKHVRLNGLYTKTATQFEIRVTDNAGLLVDADFIHVGVFL